MYITIKCFTSSSPHLMESYRSRVLEEATGVALEADPAGKRAARGCSGKLQKEMYLKACHGERAA